MTEVHAAVTDLVPPDVVLRRWNELAELHGQPMAAPGWMLPWFEHLRPPGARRSIVTATAGERIVALAPLTAERWGGCTCYRLLSGIEGRTSILTEPGYEWEAAGAIADCLAAAQPPVALLRFERTAAVPSLPSLLATVQSRHRGSVVVGRSATSSPVVHLVGCFEGWLSAKSANFRSEMRRLRRRFEQAGGATRLSTTATMRDDLDVFLRLHAIRWRGQGSAVLAAGTALRAALRDSASALPDGWLRIHVSEIDGVPISAHVFFAAGGELTYYNGGWDEGYARLKPGMLGLLDAIEHAFRAGDRRLDLGPGAYAYKSRLADADDPLVSLDLVIPRPQLAPRAALHGARLLIGAAAARATPLLRRRTHPTGERPDRLWA